ncbi:MAG: hypothetical protein KGK07_13585 [Chloroflexota bacterium]|nr:hypothetical protein [Chloroflexota bacterium]
MKAFRIRAIPINRPVMPKPGAPSSPGAPPGGGGGGGGAGGGGGDDAGDAGDAPAAAEQAADDVDIIGQGTFAGVPLWQWLVLGAAFLWTRKG